MFASFLQTLLPGIRDARTPFVAGLLWTVFLWILFARSIEPALSVPGFPQQAFTLAQHVGGTALVSAVVIGAYVLGVLATTLSNSAHAILTSTILRPSRAIYWNLRMQRLVRKKRAQLRKASTSGDDDKAKGALNVLRTHARFGGAWSKLTPEVTRITGELTRDWDPDAEGAGRVLGEAIGRPAAKGAWEQFAAQNTIPDEHFRADGYDLYRALQDQLENEPLDLLRAIDEATYQELDRLRSEREFRLAVSLPVIALGAYVSLVVTPWGGIAVLLAAATFVQASVTQSREASRVVHLLVARGLPEALRRDAEEDGKAEARKHIARQAKAKDRASTPREG